jgi:hypothetical protein
MSVGDGQFDHAGGSERLMTELTAGSGQHGLQPDRLSFFQADAFPRNLPHTNSGPLKVLDNADRGSALIRSMPNGFDGGGVRLMGPMREIQPRGVHALLDQAV